MNEIDALQRFWVEANGGVSRLELLREYAALKIGPCVDAAGIRELSQRARWHHQARECFACGWSWRQVRLIWHHVIQVQHGGSSSLWNQVRLCEDCHALVHPWLQRPACKGWTSTLDAAQHARGGKTDAA